MGGAGARVFGSAEQTQFCTITSLHPVSPNDRSKEGLTSREPLEAGGTMSPCACPLKRGAEQNSKPSGGAQGEREGGRVVPGIPSPTDKSLSFLLRMETEEEEGFLPDFSERVGGLPHGLT